MTGRICTSIIVLIQHPTPFYDDSYAVNSANNGPYGDAITRELIPEIERRFRGLGPWARFLYGGSPAGWEALAAQIFYPDEYNGAFGACPDPGDFRAYMQANLYHDANAYFEQGPFSRIERPSHRNYLGEIDTTMRGENHWELVLGTRGRSGQQFDAWQAVFSPLGEDGYPAPIFDKRSGAIDRDIAAYWRERYDLRHILERDWATLGPKLRGKLHVYCGDMDNYYLNNGVYLLEAFLAKDDPPADALVDYGDGRLFIEFRDAYQGFIGATSTGSDPMLHCLTEESRCQSYAHCCCLRSLWRVRPWRKP